MNKKEEIMKKNDYSEQVVKGLKKLAQKYSMHNIFFDFIKVFALSIQNSFVVHDDVWEQRETEYLAIIKKYSEEERTEISRLLGLLVSAYEQKPFADTLGEIYMSCSLGNKHMDQYFTPYYVARMMAEIQLKNDITEPFSLYEPTCGSGVMIIAAAETLHHRNINYQKYLKVTAQDLDWTCVYMTYIQLSLLGIKAHVMQGDTLSEPVVTDPKRIFVTPACHPAFERINDLMMLQKDKIA